MQNFTRMASRECNSMDFKNESTSYRECPNRYY